MWRARGKNGKEKADPSRMEIKRFESLLELTVYLFGCKSDNENVRTLIDRNPTQLFASDFPLTKVQFLFYYFRTSLISLLSETFVSAIWNHVLPCFFFRKKIIYPNSRFHFCGQFFLPQRIRGYKIICISADRCFTMSISEGFVFEETRYNS